MMPTSKINIFDFDGTLSTDTWPKFWVWIKKFGLDGTHRNDELESALAEYRTQHDGNNLETFFAFFSNLLKENHSAITLDELMEGEQYIKYNPGLEAYLQNATTQNYIVSGGLVEFLNHLQIAQYFKDIYGTSVTKDGSGNIVGIDNIMTDAKKIDAIKDILAKNHRAANDCKNVSYVGDGYSDAESMKYIHEHGGTAIFVHQQDNSDKYAAIHNAAIYNQLQELGVVDYNVIADFSPGSELCNLLENYS